MTKKNPKGGPLALGDFWGKASLAGDENPGDPWRVGRDPWKGRRKK